MHDLIIIKSASTIEVQMEKCQFQSLILNHFNNCYYFSSPVLSAFVLEVVWCDLTDVE